MFLADKKEKDIDLMHHLKSPIRYVGGKSRLVNLILNFIPDTITELCSPFLGGGSIELTCASKGIKVFAYDSFQLLIDFWTILLENPRKLAEKVQKFYPLKKERFYTLQKECPFLVNKFERAVAFFVLNCCSYSGTTLSGGMCSGHPRFTLSKINYLRTFKINNFEPACLDFKNSLKKHKNTFLYLDPPYMIAQNLYGIKGNTHRNFDHIGLSKILKKRNNWLLSYNDCKHIREIYQEFKIIKIEHKYSITTKKTKELLIMN